MLDTADTIVTGTPFSFDIGQFNDDYFVYIAAFGIFTDVSYETKQSMKNILGHMAYIRKEPRDCSIFRLIRSKSYMTERRLKMSLSLEW